MVNECVLRSQTGFCASTGSRIVFSRYVHFPASSIRNIVVVLVNKVLLYCWFVSR